MIVIKKEDYLKTVRREYPPLLVEIFLKGFCGKKYHEKLHLSKVFAHEGLIVANYSYYYSKSTITEGAKLFYKDLMEPERFKKITRELERREEVFLASTSFEEFVENYLYYLPSMAVPFLPEHLIEKKARALIEEVAPEELEEYMHALNIPLQDNYYKEEEYELMTTDDLAAHTKKWAWLMNRYGSREEYSIEAATQRKESVNAEQYLAEREEEKKKIQHTLEKLKTLLGEQAHIVDVMQWAVYYRTQRTDVMNKAQYDHYDLQLEQAQKMGISYEDLLYCTLEECKEQKVDKEKIQERKKGWLAMHVDGNYQLLTGKDKENIEKELEDDIQSTNFVKGMVASKGKVTGKVKIIKNAQDTLEAGDILITSMTTPNMIPIMKKAAAFVTDEGGITCHAAIVSREMGKPCVIGTKDATRVFKDGDLVEVDAEKGIVKKL